MIVTMPTRYFPSGILAKYETITQQILLILLDPSPEK